MSTSDTVLACWCNRWDDDIPGAHLHHFTDGIVIERPHLQQNVVQPLHTNTGSITEHHATRHWGDAAYVTVNTPRTSHSETGSAMLVSSEAAL